jgi:hypothetical protein
MVMEIRYLLMKWWNICVHPTSGATVREQIVEKTAKNILQESRQIAKKLEAQSLSKQLLRHNGEVFLHKAEWNSAIDR